MAFRDNLKKHREQKGLTPEQTASAVGASIRQYSSWERGVGEPSLLILKRLAEAFETTADALLAGVGDPSPPEPESLVFTGEHQGFLQAIRENPADDSPRLIYSDWLEEHGEPEWAEFIRLQCQLARLTEYSDADLLLRHLFWSNRPLFSLDRLDPDLAGYEAARRRSNELLDNNRKRWFGEDHLEGVRVWFTRGFQGLVGAEGWPALRAALNGPLGLAPFENLEIRLASFAEADELLQSGVLRRRTGLWLRLEHEEDVAEIVRRLGDSDQVGRLTTLQVLAETGETFDMEPVVRALVEGRGWGELHQLFLYIGYPYDWPVALSADMIQALAGAAHLRQLKKLTVAVAPGRASVSALTKGFPLLQALEVDGLSAEGALALADASLPALRDLDFNLRSGSGPAENRAGVAALLTSPRFPKLGAVRMVNAPDDGMRGVGALLAGPCRAPTLRCLGLLHVSLGPEDAAGLARCPAFREVMVLDLSSNPLGSEGAVALAAGHWPRLASVDLSSCEIGEDGAVALAGAAGMPEMQVFQLTCNHFGPEGCKAFTPGPFPHLRRLSLVNCGGVTGTKITLRRRFGKVLDM